MKVQTAELRKAMECLCLYLDEMGLKEIDLPQVHYWAIAPECEHDLHTEPASHSIGDLEDDWSELRQIIKGDKPPIGYACVWLSAILRAVGQNARC